jgi:hypothetical protein
MVRLLQAGGGTLNKRYESRSLRHIVQHGDPDRDRFWEIPDIPWKEDLPDDELDLPLDHDTDDLSAASELSDLDMDETNTALTPVWQDEQPLLHSEHCRFPPTRYPVWERRVRLLGETRLYLADCNLRGRSRLIPHDVRFTSPPTLPREIIICGSVLARFEAGRQMRRQVALPFQRHFTAWPVQDGDTVCAELLHFIGSRICPILVSGSNGRIRRACELKIFFDALVQVFPRMRHGGRRRTC